ncbi:HSF-type DNA-binding [Seminavis robusta]|uniref:HSF-type DNA-binding n=1 Tax=Seminavis robusta TaxID=568900 RepID=A0A9N8EZ58_9STRA|nr:HSF-type DNA-binding [Seminavis robusta]|eukprot:Sro2049_g312570.1 HSF-type DNA-binding (348) ;mRNA; r:11928-13128
MASTFETTPTNSKRKAEIALAEALVDGVNKANESVLTATTSQNSPFDGHQGETVADAAKSHEGDRPQKKAKSEIDESTVATTQEAIAAKLNAMSKKSNLSDYEKCSIFPQKLMQLLKNDEAPDAIWWLEDGESFAIEQEQFTKVMNKVSRTSKKKVKLDSILRNLYRWGFKKLKDRDLPPNVLAYSHPKFKRDASVELQTFSKKPEKATPAFRPSMAAPPSALARALSARAQAGYGDNWNEEGAADKSSMMMHAASQPQNPYDMLTGGGQQRLMMQSVMLQQQQQQQRQMLLQQELFYHEQQQRQALLLERASAERAAYAAQRFAGAPAPGFHSSASAFHQQPPYPF